MSAIRKVRKAIFPAAGLGTRFLPATKAMPKEMLTVLDRPLIQWVVQEARDAGIEQFIFVISNGKDPIINHFDKNPELHDTLKRRGKTKELALVEAAEMPVGFFSTVRQPEPLGLGHAVWCARELVGDEPFAVILPDEIVQAPKGALTQAMEVYEKTGGNVITVTEVPRADTSKYGICATASDDGRVVEINGLVEKPHPDEAPSNISIHGRYIFQPEIFKILDEKKIGAGGEIQLTDAMAKLIETQKFHGVRVEGKRYDCGQKLGFVEANIAMAVSDPDIGPTVKAMLQKYI